jgi:hypothetical protein
MEEQRKAVLIRPPLPCHWGPTDDCLRNGKVTRLSISYKTCFIQTKAPANDGQSMFVKIWLPDEMVRELSLAHNYLLLRGQVVRYSPKIGFGLHFGELSEGEGEMLSILIGHLCEKPASGS